ncbi:MAG: hypothetical protein C4309_08070, partial [Chloroflexota bacterium]
MDTIALNIQHVSKSFGGGWRWLPRLRGRTGEVRPIVAVNDITLQVRRGEIFGVLGPNGSGKSTLIRLISTLLLPDRGTITVFGHDVVKEERAVQRLINRVS